MGWHVGLMYCSMEGNLALLRDTFSVFSCIIALLLFASVNLSLNYSKSAVLLEGGLPLPLVHLQPTGISYAVFSHSQYMLWQGKKSLAGCT